MEIFEETKHRAVGHKLRNMFLRFGTKNMISIIKPVSVVLPKMIHLLESLASDFKNAIFKMTSDTLGKGEKK